MSGAVSIGAAVIATTFAVSTVAEVGLTIGAAFAIAGAVGATAAAVGTIAKIPELKIAGMALGAVGAIGSIASAAGAFGEVGSIANLAGGAGTDAGTWAGVGGDAITAVAQTTPWTPETLSAATSALNQSAGVDLVDLVTSTVPLTEVPTVGPAGVPNIPTGVPENVPLVDTLQQIQTPLPAYDPNAVVPPLDLQPPPSANALLRQEPLIPQGTGGEGATLGTVPNQYAPQDPLATSTGQQGLLQQTPAAPPGAPTQAGSAATGRVLDLGKTNILPGTPNEPSTWKNILDFTKNNQFLVYGALQAGGSFLSGAFGGGLTQEQQTALEAQAEQNRAAANLYDQQANLLKQRQINMSQIPAAYRQRQSQSQGGISPGPLNSPVTGRPA